MAHEFDKLREKTNFKCSDYSPMGTINYSKSVFVPGAKCPNHHCKLYLTDQPGIGRCIRSGAFFHYEEGPAIEEKEAPEQQFEVRIVNGQYVHVPIGNKKVSADIGRK